MKTPCPSVILDEESAMESLSHLSELRIEGYKNEVPFKCIRGHSFGAAPMTTSCEIENYLWDGDSHDLIK